MGPPVAHEVGCLTLLGLQPCNVPLCPPQKALDFSLDNDQKPDENNSYTHASLQMEAFPPSFTICTAFMVEWWTVLSGENALGGENVDSWLFSLQSDSISKSDVTTQE